MGSIRYVEICDSFVGRDEAVLEVFAPASMRGLRHKVRHKFCDSGIADAGDLKSVWLPLDRFALLRK
jgi:hypothetical protein